MVLNEKIEKNKSLVSMVHVSFSCMDLQIFNIFIFIFQIWKLLKALLNYIIILYEGIAIFL